MTPMTPMLDTPAGRLAELVHLLTDAPLSDAVTVVNDSTSHSVADDDPWWVVASALVQLKNQDAPAHHHYEWKASA